MSLGPFLRTPFTDYGGSCINNQVFDDCAKMEMKAMDCLEAYGTIRGATRCQNLLDDFMECRYGHKQYLRWNAMRAEREKQISEGKLVGNEKYGMNPRLY